MTHIKQSTNQQETDYRNLVLIDVIEMSPIVLRNAFLLCSLLLFSLYCILVDLTKLGYRKKSFISLVQKGQVIITHSINTWNNHG